MPLIFHLLHLPLPEERADAGDCVQDNIESELARVYRKRSVIATTLKLQPSDLLREPECVEGLPVLAEFKTVSAETLAPQRKG